MNILFLFFIVPFVSGVPVYLTSFFTSLLIILQFLEEYASLIYHCQLNRYILSHNQREKKKKSLYMIPNMRKTSGIIFFTIIDICCN